MRISNILVEENIKEVDLKNGKRTWIGIFFPKEDIWMTIRYIKIYSTSLVIRKVQMKTIMRYGLRLVGMTVVKKTINNKCRQECEEKETFIHCWWECKLVHPLWKTVWGFLKKLRIERSYNSTIPFLGVYPKIIKTLIWKGINICTPIFITAICIGAKIWEQPRASLVAQ